MATVYFVREGLGKADRDKEVSIITGQQASSLFGKYKTQYDKDDINITVVTPPQPVNPVSEFRFVVLKIDEEDLSPKFPEVGLYFIKDLTPTECYQMLQE